MVGLGAATLLQPKMLFAQSTQPIKVGALLPITGAGSPYGTGILETILAATKLVNEAGGVAGRQIEIIVEDDQTNPQAGVLAAKKLIEVNRVSAIIGGWSSSVSMSVMPMTNEANIPFFYASTAPDLSFPTVNTKKLGYRFQGPASRFGNAFAAICEKEGFKRAAVMAFNNGSAVGIADSFEKAWKERGNDVVARVIYEPAQTSYRAELQQVLAAQPDVIVTGSYLTDTSIILKDWYQSGASNKWIMPTWAVSSELIGSLGNEVVEGIYSVSGVSNLGSDAFKTYDEAYRAAMGVSGDTNIDAAQNWDMLNVLALAIEAANGDDGPAFHSKIREVSGTPGTVVTSFAEGRDILRQGGQIDYEGASSSVNFEETNDVSTDFAVSRIENGVITRQYTLSAQTL